MTLSLQPITFAEMCAFVELHHRHHKKPQGWKFGIGVNDGERLVGVASVGRPVSRHLDNGWTLEVTRLCTDGTKNAASMLYGASWRAAKAMGYTRLITYILDEEKGTTLNAAGWRLVGAAGGGTWNRPNRERTDKAPTQQKQLWEAA